MLFTPINPMNAVMRKEAFDSDRYLFDVKWDGWRLLLHKEGYRVAAYSKKGNVLTDKFPELQDWAAAIKSPTAIIDCEVVCLRENGRTSFDDISYRGRLSNQTKIAAAVRTHPATLIPFDVLQTSNDNTREPLLDRKKRLQELIVPTPNIMPTLFVEDHGRSLSELTKNNNLEGVIAKEKSSKYLYSLTGSKNTKSPEWIKIKNFQTIDTVILGYQTNPFSLIVGVHFQSMKYKPVARIEHGFTPEEKQAFFTIAKSLHTKKNGQTQWIEPNLCCKIQYLDRTDNHHLRITSFKGFLPAKNHEECVWSA